METFSPPHPAIDLAPHLNHQLVYTLTGLLPPPLDDTPEALHTRNLVAIAKVAALLPVNANEADLAPSFACSVAQCIAARAQAEEMLRLLRQHAGDIGLVMRLNAQYGSMQQTSLSVHGRLMGVQALRHKREAIDGAANQDAWALHVAERSMLGVVDPDAGPHGPEPRQSRRRRLVWTRGLRSTSQKMRQILRTRLLRRCGASNPGPSPEDRVKRICARLCAKRWPDRFWPNRVCGTGIVCERSRKSRAGGPRLPYRWRNGINLKRLLFGLA
jgi:hypothetical protein